MNKTKELFFQFVDGLTGGDGHIYLEMQKRAEERRKRRAHHFYTYNQSTADLVLDRVEELTKSNKDLRKQAELDKLRYILSLLSKMTALQAFDKCKRELFLLQKKKIGSKFPEQCAHIGQMKALEFFVHEVMANEIY